MARAGGRHKLKEVARRISKELEGTRADCAAAAVHALVAAEEVSVRLHPAVKRINLT